MSRRAPHRVELLQPPSHSHRSQSLDNTLCAGLSVSIRQYIEQHSNNNKFEQVQTSWIKYFHYIATLYKLICLRTTLSSSLDQTRTQERGASKSRQKKLKLIPVQTCQKTIIGYFFPTFFVKENILASKPNPNSFLSIPFWEHFLKLWINQGNNLLISFVKPTLAAILEAYEKSALKKKKYPIPFLHYLKNSQFQKWRWQLKLKLFLGTISPTILEAYESPNPHTPVPFLFSAFVTAFELA